MSVRNGCLKQLLICFFCKRFRSSMAKCLSFSLFVNYSSSLNNQAGVLCFRCHAYSFSTLLWVRFSQYRSSIVSWTQFCVCLSAKYSCHLCMDQSGSSNFETPCGIPYPCFRPGFIERSISWAINQLFISCTCLDQIQFKININCSKFSNRTIELITIHWFSKYIINKNYESKYYILGVKSSWLDLNMHTVGCKACPYYIYI